MPVTAYVSSKRRLGPDPHLVRDQLTQLQNLLKVYGWPVFAEQLFWILRPKIDDPNSNLISIDRKSHWNRRLIPLRPNLVQRELDDRLANRNICVKDRQGGYTTFFAGRRLYTPAITEPGVGCLLISQNSIYATAHLSIVQRFHRYLAVVDPFDDDKNELHYQLMENLLHTRYRSKREIVFDQLDSWIRVESAENPEAGQGLTLQHLVGTEVARWPGKPEETLANVKEAIPDDGTVDLESTCNGLGGYFYEEAMRARDPQNKTAEFRYHFFPWWYTERYRDKKQLRASELTDEEKQVREQFQLDLYQMMWRRKKMVSLRHNFPEKYPEDDLSCWLTAHGCFFDKDVLRSRLMELLNYKPLTFWRNGEFVQFIAPIKGRRYIIGADAASGRTVTSEDTDFSAATVLDIDSGEQCGAYRTRCAPEDFAEDLVEIARAYNSAKIIPERNGDGTTVILWIQSQLRYHNVYMHKEPLKRDRKKLIEIAGWPTTPKTRPQMLNRAAWQLRNYPELIWDKTLVGEALRFTRDEKGKPAAEEGTHDDTIFGFALANVGRQIELGYYDPLGTRSEKYGEEPDENADGEVEDVA